MQVFLSYNHESDQAFVAELTEALNKIDVSPQIINLRLKYGDAINEKVEEALRNCEKVIVVLSDGFVKSKWHQKELFAFLLREVTAGSQSIIPILLEDCDYPAMLDGRICDFRRKSFKQGFKILSKRLSLSRQVFIVMKFDDDVLNSAYKGVIRPLIEEFNYRPLRIDEILDSGKITDQILKEIAKSEVIIVDLTGERPNCYYEAGYAHALEKKIIFTIRKKETVHFDLAGYRFIEWATEQDLREQLRKRLQTLCRVRRPALAKYKTP
jgi:hypothetical protein